MHWGILDRVCSLSISLQILAHLMHKLGAVTADNASPNDVMIQELGKTVESFLGSAMHIRCFDHSLNLMAKVSS